MSTEDRGERMQLMLRYYAKAVAPRLAATPPIWEGTHGNDIQKEKHMNTKHPVRNWHSAHDLQRDGLPVAAAAAPESVVDDLSAYCRIAAETYYRDAAAAMEAGVERISQQFTAQAEAASCLADYLDEEPYVVIERM